MSRKCINCATLVVLPSNSHAFFLLIIPRTHQSLAISLCLSVLGLHVLIRAKGSRSTEKKYSIKTNAHARRSGGRCGGSIRLSQFGHWVPRLWRKILAQTTRKAFKLLPLFRKISYLTLQGSDLQAGKDISRLITVSNILECFCRVLATYIEQNLLSTSKE
jgi:hypothetical protein